MIHEPIAGRQVRMGFFRATKGGTPTLRCFCGFAFMKCRVCTLPETKHCYIAPENGWLEDYDLFFLLGWPIFRGELLVSGSVHPKKINSPGN